MIGKGEVERKTTEKVVYIEYIRFVATIAVVFLHIVVTLNNNYEVNELGVLNYTIFSDCYILVKWAVPCFIMVTGALLLDKNKVLDVNKITKYIGRMVLVLLFFGTIYAIMELLFTEKRFNLLLIVKSVVLAFEGKSWDHLWYIYVIIALYIITIPLKCFIDSQDRKIVELFLGVLVVGNFIIPTINTILGLSLESYMLLNRYATYYLLGYYLSSDKENNHVMKLIYLGVLATFVMLVSETVSLYINGVELLLNHSESLLAMAQAVGVFVAIKSYCTRYDARITPIIKVVGIYSFGIYLIHPFWINFLYKVLGITPLSMPIGIGIILLTIAVFLISLFSTWIVKKIPIIKNII